MRVQKIPAVSLRFSIVVAFIAALSIGAWADQPDKVPAVPVEFGGQEVLTLAYGAGSFSASDRAKAAEERIKNLSEDRLFDPSTITSTEQDGSTDIAGGDLVILNITDRDAQELNRSRSSLASDVISKIQTAIDEDRKSRSPKQLLFSSAYALGATSLLLVILFFLRRAIPKTKKWISSMQGTRIKPLRIRSLEVLTAERITRFYLWLLNTLKLVSLLLLFYIYIPLVLSFFPLTAGLAPKLFGFILHPIHVLLKVVVDFIPNLFFILIITLAARYLLKFVRFFFDEIEKETLRFQGFYKEWAQPTYKLVQFIILAFTLVVVFPYLPGSGSAGFRGVSIFLGILVSFGSSSAIANIVSGLVLTYMRPFKIGDRVKISDTIGDVMEKNLLITRVRTIKNVDITIPNSMVLGTHIINFSSIAQIHGLIVHTTITIGYDVPWKTIHRLLIDSARATLHIEKTPDPFVLQTSLDDFYVSYQINAYTKAPNQMATIYSELHQNIQDAFNKAGVEINSPHFAALRDGNEAAMPKKSQSPSANPPRFQVDVHG